MNSLRLLYLSALVIGLSACGEGSKMEAADGPLKLGGTVQTGQWELTSLQCNGDATTPIFPSVPERYQSELTISADTLELSSRYINTDETTCINKITFKEVKEKLAGTPSLVFTIDEVSCTGFCNSAVFQVPCNTAAGTKLTYSVNYTGRLMTLSESDTSRAQAVCAAGAAPAEWIFSKFN